MKMADDIIAETQKEKQKKAAAAAYQTDPIGYTIPELSEWMRSQKMEEAKKTIMETGNLILIAIFGTCSVVIDERGFCIHQKGKRYPITSRAFIEYFCGENSVAPKAYRQPECLIPFITQKIEKILKPPTPPAT